MKIRSLSLLCTFLFSLSLLCGCVSSTPANSQESVSGQEKLTVVTSFYPVFISTINVTGAVSSVEVLNMTTAQTGCLHDYQLTPQNLEILEKADVFIVNGAGMESFLDDVVAQLPDLLVIDASSGIETITDENGQPNPHVWVSITNAMKQVRNIADGLALRDTANAMSYKQNASLYLAKLSALRNETKEALSSIKTRDIITFHEAFPYFADEFGLNILAVIEREPNSTPTAKELEKTIQIIKDSGSKVIFAEPQYSSSVAETIANETGAKIFTLDPIVTGDATSAARDAYITTMTQNAAILKEALK